MTLVRLSKAWSFPDVIRQTPGETGCWDGIRFTTDEVDEADYVVVLTSPKNVFRVSCAPSRVWALMLEPPDEDHIHIQKGDQSYRRVYTQDLTLCDSRYVHSYTPLPWFVKPHVRSIARPAASREKTERYLGSRAQRAAPAGASRAVGVY